MDKIEKEKLIRGFSLLINLLSPINFEKKVGGKTELFNNEIKIFDENTTNKEGDKESGKRFVTGMGDTTMNELCFVLKCYNNKRKPVIALGSKVENNREDETFDFDFTKSQININAQQLKGVMEAMLTISLGQYNPTKTPLNDFQLEIIIGAMNIAINNSYKKNI